MDNKLLRHDLLHSNENLVTPRCCEDAGAGFVGRSLKNSRPVIFSQNEDFDIAHHSIIQYFKHIISPPPGGGGNFRDSSGFAALRIDMSCVLSHKRKRRKRLLKQIGRNIAGSLPISAETYVNISIGTAVSPCASVSRKTDPGPLRTTAQKDSPLAENMCKLLRMCRIYKKSGCFLSETYRSTHSRRITAKGRFSLPVLLIEMTWDETEYHKAM